MIKSFIKKHKVRVIFYGIILLLIIASLWSWVPVTERFSLDLVPGECVPVRIVLITDLHSCRYGNEQHSLIRRVEKEDPDIVLLGGDIFDDKLSDENAKYFVEAIAKEYPCFYVTGNHEYWSERVPEIKEYLNDIGVTVLAGDCSSITVNDVTLDICGVDDPTRMTNAGWREQLDLAYEASDDTHVRILLSHRPEAVDIYEQYDFDLICAGHAHAGQMRIPFINRGLYAPNQGAMAEYVSGLYELENGSIMEVSRGLARESTPAPRFFNHPEVVVLDLY
jgi:hypothetical protein